MSNSQMMGSSAMLSETISACFSEAQSDSIEHQHKALQTLSVITKVSPQNRNLVAKTNGAVSTLLDLSKSSSSSSSSSTTIQSLSLSILFNLSLNPDLKKSLAEMETIHVLNSIILAPVSPESSRLAASLVCSLAMLDKNKAKFGVAGTVEVLADVISKPRGPATHHILSSLAELVQFHGNCTLAVRSGAIQVLIQLVESSDGDDLVGTSLTVLSLLARFVEGLNALVKTEHIVNTMLNVLKGRCTFSKEGAAEILLRLFDESEECLREALSLPEFVTALADLSIRGSARAREKTSYLMKKMMEAEFSALIVE